MEDLQVILNDAMRLLLKKKLVDRVRVEDLCIKTGIESINRMVAEEQIRIVWGAINSPKSALTGVFKCVSGGPTRASTRGDLTTSARTSLGTENVPHTAIMTWNKTDEALRNEKKKSVFKKSVRRFVGSLPLR